MLMQINNNPLIFYVCIYHDEKLDLQGALYLFFI